MADCLADSGSSTSSKCNCRHTHITMRTMHNTTTWDLFKIAAVKIANEST